MSEQKHYAERDVIRQGQHYMTHVGAMTREGLHSKADIAAELAHRDIEIIRMTLRIAELERSAEQPKCSPTLTECPKCLNRIADCPLLVPEQPKPEPVWLCANPNGPFGENACRRLPGCGWCHQNDRCAHRAAPPAATVRVTEEMVSRFLGWPLPANFCPDNGVTFTREANGKPRDPNSVWWPIGTNLLTAPQARAMLEYVLQADQPAQPEQSRD